MVKNLGELPKCFVVNSRTESFGNSSVFAFSLLLFVLSQNYNFAFRDYNGKWMLPFANAIVTHLHCVYLMQNLHHNLLDLLIYLMMQSSLWKMVRTWTSDERILDIPEGSAGCGRAKPHVATHLTTSPASQPGTTTGNIE
jgi:hypothetical protein